MRPKAAPAKGRRSEGTQGQRERSTKAEPSRDLGAGVERPLDAEDVALASLEAQIRAKEAQADLASTGQDAVVPIRLSGAVIARLEAEAKRSRITRSELIRRAIMQYLK